MTKQSMSDSPFVGLRPFRSTEHMLFFARRQQTIELLDRLHRTRFVSVVGSSGSGKSSLVRAGLIPNLEAGFLVEDRDRWVSAVMTPGEAPIENLATSVLTTISGSPNLSDIAGLVDQIRSLGPQAIVNALAPVLNGDDTNFLLLVDQFEELFRFGLRTGQAERRDEATDFVSILLGLTKQQTAPIYIVMTMRSDFLGDCDAFYGLPEAMNRSQYLVPRLTRLQRREAVEGPIRLCRQTITPQLLDRVLNDAGDEPDQLPIMQHALLRTWEKWQQNGDGPVDLPHYEAVGTMQQALSRDADAALIGLSEEDLKLSKRIFQALTDTDAANRRIRRPARLSELEVITEASREKLMEIVDRFRGQGRSFLVVSEDKTHDDLLIDICHESLIRQWKLLRDWVDEEARSGKMYRRVGESAERHVSGQEGTWRDPQLQLALEEREGAGWNQVWATRYRGDFDQAMAFLDLSREERDREARQKQTQQRLVRRMTAALFALSFLILVGFTYLFYHARKVEKLAALSRERADAYVAQAHRQAVEIRREADEQRRIAITAVKTAEDQREEAEADHGRLMGLRLGAEALSRFELSEKSLVQSGILAIESLKVEPTFEGRKALAKVLRLLPGTPQIEQAHQLSVRALAFSRDGQWMASVGQEGTVILWDLKNQMKKMVLENHFPTAPSTSGLAFSWDGRWLAAGGMGTLRIWDTKTARLAQEIKTQGQFVRSVAFNADGQRIGAAVRGSGATIFQKVGDGWEETKPPASGSDKPDAIALLDNRVAYAGKSVFTFRFDSFGVWFLDMNLENPVSLPSSHGQACRALSLNEHMSFAALCDQGILLVDSTELGFQSSGQPQIAGADFSTSYGISLSHSGKYVAAADNSGIVHVFGNPIAQESTRLLLPSTSVAFGPDDRVLAAGLQDGSIALWPTTHGAESIRVPFNGVATGLAFGTDELLLATGEDGSVRIFDVPNMDNIRPQGSFSVGPDLRNPAFSPDNRLLAVFDKKSMHLFQVKPWKSLGQYDIAGDGAIAAFSPDGRMLIVFEPGRIRRFVAGATTWQEKLPSLTAEGLFKLEGLRFSPDGRWLATVQDIRTGPHSIVNLRQVWNIATGVETAWQKSVIGIKQESGSRAPAGGPPGLVDDSTRWRPIDKGSSPDGQWHAELSRSTLVLQEGSTGRPVANLEHDGNLIDAAFSPHGRWLATSSEDGTIRLWPLQAKEMIARACKLLPRNLTGQEWKELNLEGKYHKTCPELP